MVGNSPRSTRSATETAYVSLMTHKQDRHTALVSVRTSPFRMISTHQAQNPIPGPISSILCLGGLYCRFYPVTVLLISLAARWYGTHENNPNNPFLLRLKLASIQIHSLCVTKQSRFCESERVSSEVAEEDDYSPSMINLWYPGILLVRCRGLHREDMRLRI